VSPFRGRHAGSAPGSEAHTQATVLFIDDTNTHPRAVPLAIYVTVCDDPEIDVSGYHEDRGRLA
jgi:hypothetical protein